MEPNTRCSYVGCNKTWRSGERFHTVPVRNPGLCVKWLINSGCEDLLTYETAILESMNLVICSDHFQDDDYSSGGLLKGDTVPLQYWDVGCMYESDDVAEANIHRELQTDTEDSLTSIDSEQDSEFGTDDELRTQLGNEIEALLNSFTSRSRAQHKMKPNLGQSLRNFYTKLRIKKDTCKNKVGGKVRNLVEFKTATKDMCRTCAKRKTNLIDMADKTVNSDVNILTKLKLLIEIKDRDVLPTKICHECLARLEHSYDFFQQIYKADNILHDMLFKHKRSCKTVSKQSKYNNYFVGKPNFKRKNHSPAFEGNDFHLEVNDMPFKDNVNSTWKLENNVDDGSIIDTYNSHDSDQNEYPSDNVGNKSSIKNEDCSSENTENTVSYLLSDFYNNDAELNWLDVVGAMEKKPESDTSKSSITVDKAPASALRVSCTYCDSTFRLRRQLKSHITVNHLHSSNYICEFCNISCKSKEHMSEHLAQAHSRQRYECDDCHKTFCKKKNLRYHIKRIHSTTCEKEGDVLMTAETTSCMNSQPHESFTCNDCQKTFTSKQILSNHIHRLHPPFAYTCMICKAVMHSEDDTYKHMTTHDKPPLFPCLDCGRMYYNIDSLEKHRSRHSNNTSKKRKRVWFHCQLCDASYNVAHELMTHIGTHSSEDWESYRNKILYCGECSARLIGNEKFRIHKMRYHLAKRGDYICLLCDDVLQDFQSVEDYERHIDMHYNELKRLLPRRYKCEHCDKAFKSNSHRINHIDTFHSDVMLKSPISIVKVKRKGNLKDHVDRVHNSKIEQDTVEVHVEEKRFPCRFCGEELLTGKQLSQHEEIHQKPFEDLEKLLPWTQRYTCDHCGIKFYYIDKLRKHLLEEHQDKEKAAIVETLEKNRKFKCTECDASFQHKSGFHAHMKGVHLSKEHVCPICGIICKLPISLKKHLLLHHVDRLLHKCQYCEQEFKHEEERRNHELNHHTDDQPSDVLLCIPSKIDLCNNDGE